MQVGEEELAQAARDQHPVFVQQRGQIGHRAQRDQIEQVFELKTDPLAAALLLLGAAGLALGVAGGMWMAQAMFSAAGST